MSKINHLFEEMTNQHPNQYAVYFLTECITYYELNNHSNQLARYLVKNGTNPGEYIPIIANKSIETVIAVLAILKAGAVYVPIHPDTPQKTMSSILSDVQARIVFIQSNFQLLPLENVHYIKLEHLKTLSAEFSQANLAEIDLATDEAYIIHTSGTTGKPKGVIVSHQNLINTFQSWKIVYKLTAADHHLQMAHFSFDVFTGDWVRALCSGGRLVLCPQEVLLNSANLYSLIKTQKINCAEFVPVILRRLLAFVEKEQLSLSMFRLMICGSEQWTMTDFRRTQKACGSLTRVINSYGVTECAIDSTYFETSEDTSFMPGSMTVPIGKPFPHVRLFILDQNKQPVKDQNIGEIYIGGTGVAKGYFGQPALTNEKFRWIDTSEGRERAYRTGDEAYFLKNGNIIFLGRNESQIKINGQRVELPAIENLLNEHPKIKQAVVTAVEVKGSQQINCFLLLNDSKILQSELVNYLRQILPCYSIPKHFYEISEINLNPSGKIDRRVISQKTDREIKPIISKPRNDLEIKIAKIWAEILKLEVNEIGRDQSFAEQGGSSLEYVNMLEILNQQFSLKLPLNINAETIPILASHISYHQQNRKYKIAIIGGGPAGISTLIQLLAHLKNTRFAEEIEIAIFEKSSKIGMGLPYFQRENCHILNLPKEIMEPVAGQMGIFADWLKNIPGCPQDTAFPPRFYFGEYLHSLAKQLQENNDGSGIIIKYHTQCEVSDIQIKDSNEYLIKTPQGQYHSQYVILCTGHMPPTTYRYLMGSSGYYHNPWDQNVFTEIKPVDHVGIIGTRLTAIDVALKLFSTGHQGQVTMISRTGLLPTVLSPSVPHYNLKYLTLNNFIYLTKSGLCPLSLDTLLELFWKEVSEAENHSLSWENIVKSGKELSALEWLNHEIAQAERGPKPWQQVLFAIYPILSNIWTYLSFSDRKLFLEKYYSVFMTYMAAFPLENAYKLRYYLQSGQLQVISGLKDIKGRNWHYELIREESPPLIPQHLFNATGSGYNPLLTPLYANMYRNRLIRKHHLGGIEVDPQTLQVKGCRSLFAIGELTKGACLATTDIGQVNSQTQRVGLQIGRYILSQQRSRDKLPQPTQKNYKPGSFFRYTPRSRSFPLTFLTSNVKHFKI